jgi:hypothetical protein
MDEPALVVERRYRCQHVADELALALYLHRTAHHY